MRGGIGLIVFRLRTNFFFFLIYSPGFICDLFYSVGSLIIGSAGRRYAPNIVSIHGDLYVLPSHGADRPREINEAERSIWLRESRARDQRTLGPKIF